MGGVAKIIKKNPKKGKAAAKKAKMKKFKKKKR